MLVEIALVLLSLLLVLYWYITKNFGYFKSRGLAESPGTFPFGSKRMKDLMLRRTNFLDSFNEVVKDFPDDKIFGIYSFGKRELIVKDLELAKMILIKDADYFTDRPRFDLKGSDKEGDRIFDNMLLQLTGEEWKKARSMVSPVFTSGKLRLMVPHIDKSATNLEDVFKLSSASGEILEAKEVYGKFALDAISTSGFGIESNSFKDPDTIFRKTALKMIGAEEAGMNRIIRGLLLLIAPRIATKVFGMSVLPAGTAEFFAKIIRQTVKQRKETGQRRNDIIDLLLDEIKKNKDDNHTNEETELLLISNALIFFFAGFDTTSLTLAMCIFAFINNPAMQDKVRDEIRTVIGDSEITIDHIQELKFTENCINEALRFYGVIRVLQRVCTKDYRVPGTDFVIPQGMEVTVFTPSFAEDSFYNHEKFDPDNFDANNNPNKFGFAGFGQGPRNCIGMRYAYIALKLALVHTLTKFKVMKCDETVEKLQFDVGKNYFKGGVKFKVELLTEE